MAGQCALAVCLPAPVELSWCVLEGCASTLGCVVEGSHALVICRRPFHVGICHSLQLGTLQMLLWLLLLLLLLFCFDWL